jgi:uncharacterized protein (DUF952 family)
MTLIYKIVSGESWENAVKTGVFAGAAIDLADGFIHFSDAAQVEETARRHFAGAEGLVLVAFRVERFGDDLKWEPSRGGALFPHLYGAVDPALALWVKPLVWSGAEHVFPEGWRS